MTASTAWVSASRASELLGLSKSDLFKMRDDGTLRLGPHFAAFPETRSRESFRWNVGKISEELSKKGVLQGSGL